MVRVGPKPCMWLCTHRLVRVNRWPTFQLYPICLSKHCNHNQIACAAPLQWEICCNFIFNRKKKILKNIGIIQQLLDILLSLVYLEFDLQRQFSAQEGGSLFSLHSLICCQNNIFLSLQSIEGPKCKQGAAAFQNFKNTH